MNKKTRKLSLSRETVRDLAPRALQAINGGAVTITCPRPCSEETFCKSDCSNCIDCV